MSPCPSAIACCRRHRARAHARRAAVAASSERSVLRTFGSIRTRAGIAARAVQNGEGKGWRHAGNLKHLGGANGCEDGRSRSVDAGSIPRLSSI